MAAFLQSGCTAAILGRLQDADYAAAQTQTASLETPTEGLPGTHVQVWANPVPADIKDMVR